jgi:hypothetical protein
MTKSGFDMVRFEPQEENAVFFGENEMGSPVGLKVNQPLSKRREREAIARQRGRAPDLYLRLTQCRALIHWRNRSGST